MVHFNSSRSWLGAAPGSRSYAGLLRFLVCSSPANLAALKWPLLV